MIDGDRKKVSNFDKPPLVDLELQNNAAASWRLIAPSRGTTPIPGATSLSLGIIGYRV